MADIIVQIGEHLADLSLLLEVDRTRPPSVGEFRPLLERFKVTGYAGQASRCLGAITQLAVDASATQLAMTCQEIAKGSFWFKIRAAEVD